MDDHVKFHWGEGLKYVTEGIKAFFLLNGAATISMLTFLGNARNGDDKLVYSMACFAIGALMGSVAFMFAYLTQLEYGNDHQVEAWRFHRATYGSVVVGILLFLVGVGFASCALLKV
ncbi:MAG: hypothetical protein WA822_12330 [Albidovulum sp.]